MLGISLTVVALAFVPVLLLNIAWSEHAGWIGSSMIAALWITTVGVRALTRSQPVKELPEHRSQPLLFGELRVDPKALLPDERFHLFDRILDR